mmetsp:Transcript_48979/g.88540  ORF Transcript_48979/g.88540 Transcript_48979/m.88540 type:complete len:124 (-) Transcript_48979:572-943(-)
MVQVSKGPATRGGSADPALAPLVVFLAVGSREAARCRRELPVLRACVASGGVSVRMVPALPLLAAGVVRVQMPWSQAKISKQKPADGTYSRRSPMTVPTGKRMLLAGRKGNTRTAKEIKPALR